MWREYAKSDSRYLTNDGFIVGVEKLTVVCVTALFLFLTPPPLERGFANGDPSFFAVGNRAALPARLPRQRVQLLVEPPAAHLRLGHARLFRFAVSGHRWF